MSGAIRSAKPRMTPCMSFMTSQRDACSTTGTDAPAPARSRGGRRGAIQSRRAVTPGESHLLRPPRPSTRPTAVTTSRTRSGAIGFVLGGEWVDRGRDRRRAGPRGIHGGANCSTREHERVDVLDVGAQEGPRPFRMCVLVIDTDVASPHHRHALAHRHACEAGSLRIVEDDDVARARARAPSALRDVIVLVVTVFVGAERTTVAGRPVQVVVDALGDLEEAGVPFDHDPASIDTEPSGVGQHR